MDGHVSDTPHERIVSTGSDHIKAVLAASIKPGPAPQGVRMEAKKMIQVPVKWVLEKDLFVSKERVSDYEERDNIACPVVPLSALREVVEFVKAVSDKRYQTWKYHAEFADDPTDHNVMHADLMKYDPIYAEVQRLLASLGGSQ